MSHKKRVLLLNPPARNEKVIKDQYCSFTSKGDYYWIPIDLLILSGDLGKFFNVRVIDAIVEDLDNDELVSLIDSFSPDHIVLLSSLLTHDVDRKLISLIKDRNPRVKTTFLGDIFYFKSEVMIKYEEVDSIIYEYPAPELVKYIQYGIAQENIIYKNENKEICIGSKRKGKYISYETPLHEIFPLEKYSAPLMTDKLSSAILTNFGCSYTCNYCPASSVEYRQRSSADFEAELKYLSKLGISNLWIRDFTFGLDVKETSLILEILKKYNINWFGLTRAERINDGLLRGLSESGCYLLMIGIDTVDDKSMGSVNRKQKVDNLKKNINLVNDFNILVLVHLILGLPDESVLSMLKSIHFCASTKASFLSINFFSKRSGSVYFDDESINLTNTEHLDSLYFENGDKGGVNLVFLKWYALTIFYLRPSRVIRILSNLKTRDQLVSILKTGILQMFTFNKK